MAVRPALTSALALALACSEQVALAQPNNPFGNAVVLLEGVGEGNLISFQLQGGSGSCLAGSQTYGNLLLPFCNLVPGGGYVLTATSGNCFYSSGPFSVVAGGLVSIIAVASADGRGNPCSLPGAAPPVSWPLNSNDPAWAPIVNSISTTYCPGIGPNNGDAACGASDAGSSDAGGPATVGNVTSVVGELDVVRAGVTIVAGAGFALQMRDELKTGPAAGAQLEFADNSLMTVGAQSDLIIDQFVYNGSQNTGQAVLEAVKGIFRFVGGALDKHSAVVIKTPVSALGPRGTEFILQVNGTSQTIHVDLADGGVGVTPSSSSTETLVYAPASIDANTTTVTTSAFSQSAYDALRIQLSTGAGLPASPAPASSAGWTAALALALGAAVMMTRQRRDPH